MMTIELMDGEGWERVRCVRLRALLDTPDAFGGVHANEVDWEASVWQGRLDGSESATYLAVVGGEDVGIATVAPYFGKAGAASLFSMWVDSKARGGKYCGKY